MRSLLLLIIFLFACPFARWVAAPTTPTPAPHVEISASAITVRVGETITLTGVPVNLGLPIYTLMLSSGASASVTYDDQPRGTPVHDAQFEVVSARGELNRVIVTLRALAPGTAEAVISATGEARSPEGAFMWSGGSSEPLTLTVA